MAWPFGQGGLYVGLKRKKNQSEVKSAGIRGAETSGGFQAS